MRTIGYLLTYVALAVGGFFGTAWCFQPGNEEKPAAAAAAAPKGTVKATAASGPFCRSYHIMTMGNMCYWYVQDCSGTGWTSEINTCTVPFGPCCAPGPTCPHCQGTYGEKGDTADDEEQEEIESKITIDRELGSNGVTPITSKVPVSVGVTEKIKRRHIIEFRHPRLGLIKAQFVVLFTKPYKDAGGNKHEGAHFGIGRQIHSTDAPDDVNQYMSAIEEDPDNPKAVKFLWNEDELPEDIQCMVVLAE